MDPATPPKVTTENATPNLDAIEWDEWDMCSTIGMKSGNCEMEM
jgi:hypothetical protein